MAAAAPALPAIMVTAARAPSGPTLEALASAERGFSLLSLLRYDLEEVRIISDQVRSRATALATGLKLGSHGVIKHWHSLIDAGFMLL